MKLLDKMRETIIGDTDDDELKSQFDEFAELLGEDDPELPEKKDNFAERGLELFAEGSSDDFHVDEKTGYFWAPAIREGQWAVRPGKGGKKVRKPLRIVAGHSDDQRKQIGLKDLHDAFHDNAVENVTIPTSHDNKILENTGLVRDMKIVGGKHKGKPVKVLMAAYDFTEPDVKGKVERGTIPNRSCGILYDYTNTETGQKYGAVVEHIALTAKNWITGLAPFGKKLKTSLADGAELEALILSDDEEIGGEDDELDAFLASITSEMGEELAEGDVVWDENDSLAWRKTQIQGALNAMREAQRAQYPQGSLVVPSVPYWQCDDVSESSALICDGYGSNKKKWVAPYTLDDDGVVLSEFPKWKKVKTQMVEAVDETEVGVAATEETELTAKDRLALAQAERRGEEITPKTNKKATTRGGDGMTGENGKTGLQLSEEAQAKFDEMRSELDQAKADKEKLTKTVGKLTGTVQEREVNDYITHLSEDPTKDGGGLGLKEQPGVLKRVRDLLLADDGGPAVVEHLSEDGKEVEQELSLTDAIKSIFDAFEKSEEGKIKLSQYEVQPQVESEKPAAEEEESKLSDKERADEILRTNPEVASAMGLTAPEKEKVAVAAGSEGGE